MRYRLVIFDWDGTLMDSEARIVACIQGAARDIGWRALEDAAVSDIIGLGLPEAIERLCPGITLGQAEELRQHYAQRYIEAERTPSEFFAGVEAGIARLRRDPAIRLAVATGKSRRGLNRAFNHRNSGDWFDASRTADETRSKPHPLMLEELLQETGIRLEEAVMVGDTEYDLEMARTLGMDRIAVSYGVHALARLAVSHPVYTAPNFPQLIDWLHDQPEVMIDKSESVNAG